MLVHIPDNGSGTSLLGLENSILQRAFDRESQKGRPGFQRQNRYWKEVLVDERLLVFPDDHLDIRVRDFGHWRE